MSLHCNAQISKLRAGLTFVEIIVVVAIILVLAGVLGFGISAVTRRAKSTGCISNLKQVDTSTRLYLADYDDHFPPYPWFDSDNTEQNIQSYFKALSLYGLTRSQQFCPLDPHAASATKGEFHSFRNTSYMITPSFYFFNGAIVKHGVNSSRFARPSTQGYMYDQTIEMWTDTGRAIHSSHGKFANILYLDGHIKSVPIPQP